MTFKQNAGGGKRDWWRLHQTILWGDILPFGRVVPVAAEKFRLRGIFLLQVPVGAPIYPSPETRGGAAW
jgi:hypothetical protein